VSHDRDFLDNVVTSTLVFEGGGRINEYVGGYADWVRQRAAGEAVPKGAAAKAQRKGDGGNDRPAHPRPRKRSYKEQRELDLLPERIEALEAELEGLQRQLADPGAYEQHGSEGLARLGERLDAVEDELAQCYARWETLE
jgi:ATP-binding cassette subfamily F protein uup